jgi:diaminopimelate decarboxylase
MKPLRSLGKHCETDVLIEEAQLADPQRNDVVAVYSTGAYNYAMASNTIVFAARRCAGE